MSTQLYLAPAGAGKTAYVVNEARRAAQSLPGLVWVCTSTALQARSFRRRLAETGGSFGIRVEIFDDLYRACLGALGEAYVELSEPVQYRLLQGLVDALPLGHFAPLRHRPGFIHLLQGLVAELKAGEVDPARFKQATAVGGEARLVELAEIYLAYQQRLQKAGWADRAGLGWLTVEALAVSQRVTPLDGQCLIVDGFDNFTAIQISMLQQLARRTKQLIITLTGDVTADPRELVQQRFLATRARLEAALNITAEPLPGPPPTRNPALARLEARLYEASPEPIDGTGTVMLVEAADRAAEVRAALRWLKARLRQDEARPGEVALLARSMTAYRPFIGQIGVEFGLPLHFLDGLSLRTNPAVAALLDLLRLMLPEVGEKGEPVLPRRLVVEAWRSPYFDWSGYPEPSATEAIGILPGDAIALDAVARQGRVVRGYRQWHEALTRLVHQAAAAIDREEEEPTSAPLEADQAQALLEKFERFVQRLRPPQTGRYRDHVAWLEDLIGPDAADPDSTDTTGLNILRCVRAEPTTAGRDLAALRSLKEVLRGLVWAEMALKPDQQVTFTQFFEDMLGAVEAAGYALPIETMGEAILVADVIQARGIPFRAVAVLGLAEGQFPAVVGEDPLLRDADRRTLQGFGLQLELSTASAEVEFFYETITRPWEQLCLTRPRLADNGSPWPASPYWEEVNRLVEVDRLTLTSDSAPSPDRAASWPELLESLSAHPGYQPLRDWVARTEPGRWQTLAHAADLFQRRQARASGNPYEGDLRRLASHLARHLGPERPWSASRLEAYRTCPFMFFIGGLLKLEPRLEPTEGLDARQLGNIYHRLFEQVYQTVADPTDLDQLLAALPSVAEAILDEAPAQEGFRETAWWGQTRLAIVEAVKRSLTELAEQPGDFRPVAYEQGFFGQRALTIGQGDATFRVHGIIDRIDQAADGTLRIIDYKTSAPYRFDAQSVRDGKKLQLPLYALAARDALDLGQPVEGFYWHVRHGQASQFSLSTFESEAGAVGPEAAFETVIELAREAVNGARDGHFTPKPPAGGCPSYCPAAAFCWHYQPGFG